MADDTEHDSLPLHKARRHLEALETELRARGAAGGSGDAERKSEHTHVAREGETRPLVLLSTGGFMPLHRGHVAMFDHAKATLEATGKWRVVGGFYSPSHDAYCRGKAIAKGGGFFEAKHRLACIRAVAATHDYLEAASWEASQPGFVDFPGVTAQVARDVHAALGPRVVVGYLCGLDHIEKCGLWSGMSQGLVVGIGRAGYKLSQKCDPARCVIVHDAAEAPNISSTEIRRRMVSGEKITDLVHEVVAEYLYEHGILGAVRPS